MKRLLLMLTPVFLCLVLASCGGGGSTGGSGNTGTGRESLGQYETVYVYREDQEDQAERESKIRDGKLFYVAKNGNDSNPGTETQPWLTIQKAADSLITGEMVIVKAGVYNERVRVKNSGAAGNEIIFSANSGEQVIIDGTGIAPTDPAQLNGDGLFYMNGKTYIKVRGFKIRNSQTAGVYAVRSDHIAIKENYIYNTYSSGIGVWIGNNVVVDGNELVLPSNAGEDKLSSECLTIAGCNGFEVKNNQVHHSGVCKGGGEGIDAKHSSNGTIHHNRVHDLHRLGIYVDAYNVVATNIKVYSNIVYHTFNQGIACAAEEGGTLSDVQVYNNVVHDNGTLGIVVWGNCGNAPTRYLKKIHVFNNTVYRNQYKGANWGAGIWVSAAKTAGDNPYEDIYIGNNIVFGNFTDIIQVDQGVDLANIKIENNLCGIDPLFYDAQNADLNKLNFHLKVGSPAIDRAAGDYIAGNDFDGKARGGKADIGAYEY